MKGKKNLAWTAKLPLVPKQHIYLNINALENGEYTIKIIHKNKIIEEFTFKKSETT